MPYDDLTDEERRAALENADASWIAACLFILAVFTIGTFAWLML